MIVGMDCRSLLSARTGIGVYTNRLLAELEKMDGLDLKSYLHLPFLNPVKKRSAIAGVAREHPGVEIVTQSFPLPNMQQLIWSHSDLMPVESILGSVDVYHSTSYIMPPLRNAKGVLTIYDLTFMLFPEYHTREMRAFNRHIATFAGRSDCLIAISEQTKRDIVEQLHIPADRIRVTMLAADERYRVLDDAAGAARVRSTFGIDGDYILYTGTLEPRKNIPVLIRAYAALKGEGGISHGLVLAGRKGWLYEEIMESVQSLGLEQDVIFTGYVPDEEMPYLYNCASLFVYPSIYEGFGLPPLEAMACGCPVVTSNTSSLPEVVGDAGIMVDPHRPDELAQAMGRVLSDSRLRAELRDKGLKRAGEFSWQRCADETATVYRELAG